MVLQNFVDNSLPTVKAAWLNFVDLKVNQFEKSPEDPTFGAIGNGLVDDSAAIGAWLTAANGMWCTPTPGKLYRITSPMTSLTTAEIRINGVGSCYKPEGVTLAAGQSWAGFLLDGAHTTITGDWDTAGNTLSFTLRVKGLKNIVIGTTNAKYGLVEQLYSAEIDGVHFQGFTDHGIVSVGSALTKLHNISGYNVGLGKGASGTFLGGNFINGCGLHTVGSCVSGTVGNYTTARTFSSANYSSTLDLQNIFFNTVSTQTTSCKAAIICNTRSTSVKNFGTYSGVLVESSYIDFEAPHLETYATGGEVAGDGNPQSLVVLNSVVTTTTYTGTCVYEPLWLRTTAFGVATDYWGFDFDCGSRKQVSRIGIGELILGDKLQAGSTATTHVAALGTATNPLLYFDATVNALQGSKGNNFAPILSLPIITAGTVATVSSVDLTTATIMPAVDTGNGAGGVYDIDIQVFDVNTGAIYYHGTWVGVRQVPAGNYNARFYALGKVDNNAPAGGFTISENGAGPYTLRIANGTAFTYNYTVTSRLRYGPIPKVM